MFCLTRIPNTNAGLTFKYEPLRKCTRFLSCHFQHCGYLGVPISAHLTQALRWNSVIK